MTPRSIVCGVDGSEDARAALRVAAGLAGRLGLRLVAVHVVQPPVSAAGIGPSDRQAPAVTPDALVQAGRELVDRMLGEEELAEATGRVELGFPGDRLADVADEEAAELIVVGSRGRGPLKAALLGSVSTDVIGVARCAVLVVPRSSGRWSREPIGAAAGHGHRR